MTRSDLDHIWKSLPALESSRPALCEVVRMLVSERALLIELVRRARPYLQSVTMLVDDRQWLLGAWVDSVLMKVEE